MLKHAEIVWRDTLNFSQELWNQRARHIHVQILQLSHPESLRPIAAWETLQTLVALLWGQEQAMVALHVAIGLHKVSAIVHDVLSGSQTQMYRAGHCQFSQHEVYNSAWRSVRLPNTSVYSRTLSVFPTQSLQQRMMHCQVPHHRHIQQVTLSLPKTKVYNSASGTVSHPKTELHKQYLEWRWLAWEVKTNRLVHKETDNSSLTPRQPFHRQNTDYTVVSVYWPKVNMNEET